MSRLATGTTALVISLATIPMTACGGAGHGAASVPAVAPSAGSGPTSTTLRITIPAKSSTSSSNRHARYVSPATQSVAISFVPTSGTTQTFNQNLTPASNPSCQASLISPTICTLALSVLPGSYTASFVTYDGLLDGSGNPTGNKLSANQNFPVTIVAGAANALNVALQGVPVSVAFLPSIASSLRGSQAAGYTLSVCLEGKAEPVTVLGVDADGNYILGAGAPIPSLRASDTSLVSITPPTTSAPSTFVITSVPNNPSGGALTLTAGVTASTTAPTDSGAPAVTVSIPVTFDQYLCRGYSEIPTPTANAAPGDIVANGNDVWFTEANLTRIGYLASGSSTIVEYSGLSSPPGDIIVGGDGRVWFTEPTADKIGAMVASGPGIGTLTEYAVAAGSYPAGITWDGQDGLGALWFTEKNGGKVGRMTTAGVVTNEFPISGSPYEITNGPDGNQWFVETLSNQIGKITTSGVITMYNVSGHPYGIVGGPGQDYDTVWFTESQTNKIGRIQISTGALSEIPIPTANANPTGINRGADGALWFAEANASQIGRIPDASTPANPLIVEYPVTAASGPRKIVSDSTGTMWFTENTASKIGYMASY